jgi:hypothetical protein
VILDSFSFAFPDSSLKFGIWPTSERPGSHVGDRFLQRQPPGGPSCLIVDDSNIEAQTEVSVSNDRFSTLQQELLGCVLSETPTRKDDASLLYKERNDERVYGMKHGFTLLPSSGLGHGRKSSGRLSLHFPECPKCR